MKTIQEFCDQHEACDDGRQWALANCDSMQDAWDKAEPKNVIWIATRNGVLTDKELRLFAVFCARQNLHLLTDHRSINAIDTAEKFAHGNATVKDLNAAWVAARDAAGAAARAAAYAAGDTAWDAARAAAYAAAGDAARDAAWDAAYAAARSAQAKYLRKNTKPNFN